jgi:hypothetical protein
MRVDFKDIPGFHFLSKNKTLLSVSGTIQDDDPTAKTIKIQVVIL